MVVEMETTQVLTTFAMVMASMTMATTITVMMVFIAMMMARWYDSQTSVDLILAVMT